MWRWQWTLDAHLLNKCVFITLFSWTVHFVLNRTPLAYLGFWADPRLIESWTTLFLGITVVKACLRRQVNEELILLSGCDSGFGLSLALHLHGQGFCVVAGVLSTKSKGAKLIKRLQSNRIRVHGLDPTVVSDWRHVAHWGSRQFRTPLWAAVVNIDMANLVAPGDLSTEALRLMHDVCVLGPLQGIYNLLNLTEEHLIVAMDHPNSGPESVSHAALKAAVHNLIRSRAKEEASKLKIAIAPNNVHVVASALLSLDPRSQYDEGRAWKSLMYEYIPEDIQQYLPQLKDCNNVSEGIKN